MRYWTAALLGLSTAAGAQMPDTGNYDCGEMRRVIAAAAERPPFASLPAIGYRGVAMLGFPGGCGRSALAGGEPVFVCRQQLPPRALSADALAAHVVRCLPAAVRLPDTGSEGRFREQVIRFRIAGATIDLAEGGWTTRGGRAVELMIQSGG